MDLIANLQCADQPGIVHAMTTAVLNCGGNIIENQQFTDHTTNTFVMRTRFETSQGLAAAEKSLGEGLGKFSPALHIRETAKKPRALVMVTKESHCLRDLMYLLELGELPIEIPLVVSNREDLKQLVESHGIPFMYLPVDASNKAAQEKTLLFFQTISAQHFQARSSIFITRSCQALRALSLITRPMIVV